MKNKKLIVLLGLSLLAFGLINSDKILKASGSASVLQTNTNQDGLPINDAALIGRKFYTFTSSTAETLLCDTPCVIDGVYITSGATSNMLILSDSSSATGNGNVIFAPGIYMGGAGKSIVPLLGFPPISTVHGLTVDASAADGFSAVIAYHNK